MCGSFRAMDLIVRMHSTLSEGQPYDTKPFPSDDEEHLNIIWLMVGTAMMATNNLTKIELCVADTKVPIKTIEVKQVDLHLFTQAFKRET